MSSIQHWNERRIVSIKIDEDGHDGRAAVALYVNGSPVITGVSYEMLKGAIESYNEGQNDDVDHSSPDGAAAEVAAGADADPED